MRDTLFKCDSCGDTRCHSSTSAGGKKGCGVQGQGANAGHMCKVCRKGKYRNL